ncbi:MAG: DUF6544 family protein [Cyanobacteria bacterium J06621_11]
MFRSKKSPLQALWQSAPTTHMRFHPAQLTHLPDPTKRYLKHAIAPDTPLASTVRLKMHGEINLKGWQSFRAEQVICSQKGMIWQATVWMNGLPIFGWDRLIESKGAMQWKLLGLLPVVKVEGPDITRSAVGRMQGEYVWLPSALLDNSVRWQASDNTHACAELTLLEETTRLNLTLNQSGGVQAAYFKRWGDPGKSTPHYEDFGVLIEEERTFSGYTIPTKIRAGWYFESDSHTGKLGQRFIEEGEFFRATIDQAIYR